MARNSSPIHCSAEDIERLNIVIANPSSDERVKKRARIILLANDGKQNKEISALVGMSENQVGSWRRRYLQGGVQGLLDLPRSGRRGGPADETINDRIKELLSTPAEDGGEWTASLLSNRLGISEPTIYRRLNNMGIQLQRSRNWMYHTEDNFTSRSLNVLGLYIGSNECAVLFSISNTAENVTLNGTFTTKNRLLARDIEKHMEEGGTLSLQSALDAASFRAHNTMRKENESVVDFINLVVDKIPDDLNRSYLAIVCTENDCNPVFGLHNPTVSVQTLGSKDEWANAVYTAIDQFSNLQEVQPANELKNSISHFLRVSSTLTEPFIWWKESMQVTPPASVINSNETTDPDTSLVQDDGVPKITVNVTYNDGQGGFVNYNNVVTQDIPSIGSVDFTDPKEFARSLDNLEPIARSLANLAGEQVLKAVLSGVKKNPPEELEL